MTGFALPAPPKGIRAKPQPDPCRDGEVPFLATTKPPSGYGASWSQATYRRQGGAGGPPPSAPGRARPLIPIDAFGSGTLRLLAASPHHVIAGPVLDQDRVRLFSRPELQAVALVSLDLADTGHKAAFG